MQLHYLDFDFSEDELGHACWDALACVPPERWEALLAEAQALLAWCEQQGGPAGDMDAGFSWDFDLQATAERGSKPPRLPSPGPHRFCKRLAPKMATHAAVWA